MTDVTWRRSSYSNPDGGNCLEVSDSFSPAVPVRDGKAPDGPALLFAAGPWSSFVAAVRTGALRQGSLRTPAPARTSPTPRVAGRQADRLRRSRRSRRSRRDGGHAGVPDGRGITTLAVWST
ncbi:regulatory protein [Streptomyces hygroscopicus subsp. limoneus]|nr:regulatory protein [Streptomyces hygroscopicus subsp. limoneus]